MVERDKRGDAAGRRGMEHIDAIFFDLDGTLVDSGEDIARAVNYALKEAGLPERPREEIISYVGTGVEDLIVRSLGSDDRPLIDKCIGLFTGYFGEHYADKSRLYPNVKEVLEFYKGKKMVIVTNRRTELTKDTLKKFEIDRYFKKIIGGDDDNCLKPSSCPIHKGFSGVVEENEKVLMVGDMGLDILAGKQAGVRTCGVTYGIGTRKDIEKANPDYLIDNIIQLKSLIE
jgi:phosphoglycolate phosphatase